MAALTGFPRMHANAPSSSGFVRVGTLGGRYVLCQSVIPATGRSAMSHTPLAADYKIVRSALRENPDWEAVTDADNGHESLGPEANGQDAELNAGAGASLPMPCRTPASVGS